MYPRHHSSSPTMLKNNMTQKSAATPQLSFIGVPMNIVNSARSKLVVGFCQGGKKSGGAMAGTAFSSSRAVNDSAPMLKKVITNPPIAHDQSVAVIGSKRKRVFTAS